ETGYHDSGWQPIAVYEFCRSHPGRAVSCKGASDDMSSASTSPVHRWGAAPRYRIRGVEVSDPSLRNAILNTFRLKERLMGLVARRFTDVEGNPRPRLHLPMDVPNAWLEQASAEYLTQTKKGLVWKSRGPNHWGDCNAYAYAACLQLNPFQRGRTRSDQQEARRKQEESGRRRGLEAKSGRRRGVRRSY
ncbi:MAG: terminase gpA endonuclease subunit, partial [Solirubrobacterales bacterium]